MTKSQYRDVTKWTLDNSEVTDSNDSVSAAREILSNCGVSLPHGSTKEILLTLMSGDYMWWTNCTCVEAQEFAETGIPVIGIDTEHIVVITPNETEVSSNGINTAPDTSIAKTASAIPLEERTAMQFFAAGYGTTTTTTTAPTSQLIIKGIPANNTMYVGDRIELAVYLNTVGYDTVCQASWTYDNSIFEKIDQLAYHHFYLYGFTAFTEGETTITAHYGGLSCQIPIRVLTRKQFILEKIDNSSVIPSGKKSTCAAAASAMLDEGFHPAYVAGLLANICHEGNIGFFESSHYISQPENEPDYLVYMDTYYNYRNAYSRKTIMDVDVIEVYDMLTELERNSNGTWRINGSRVGFGLGCVQWSFSRTKVLVEYYLAVNNNSHSISLEQATQAETLMLKNELTTGSNAKIYTTWLNNNSILDTCNAAYNAAYDLCTRYLRPKDSQIQGTKRGDLASDIFYEWQFYHESFM